jgi:hypothetical protein
MADRNEEELAKQAIQSLVEQFQVNRVVYIDDFFEEKFEVEPMIGWLSDLQGEKLIEVEKIFIDIPLRADRDIWAQALRAFWADLSSANQKEIMLNVATIIGKDLSQDNKVVGKLPGYFPGDIQIVLISPTQWMNQKDQLLGSASAQAKTMCLFDQDLSWAKGFSSDGSKSGIGLLQEIIHRDIQDSVICCLLTHTITSLESEMNAWRELAQSNGLQLYNFLPLAKLRLADSESPVLFADGLKKAALNLHFEYIKQVAANIVRKGSQVAIHELQNLNVYDFDQMVLRSSHDDGVWEVETLMRIYQIFQRDSFVQLMLSSGNSRKMARNIEIARRLNKVDLSGLLDYGYPQVRPTRRKEIYQDNIAVIHAPLETGDIFVSLDEKKLFVLLGQPCDLVIRKDGARNNPNLAVPLVSIESESLAKIKKIPSTFWKTHARLDYYFLDRQNIAIVSFAKSYHVNIDVLDLAVIHPSGLCEIDIRKQKRRKLSYRFTPGWVLRTGIIIETFIRYEKELKVIKTYVENIVDKNIQRKIWEATMPKISITDLGLMSSPYNNGVFNFGLKRIGRIRQLGAERLLKLYTQYLSRDADEVDFAEGV